MHTIAGTAVAALVAGALTTTALLGAAVAAPSHPVETITVGPQSLPCQGVVPMRCFAVRAAGSDRWRPLYTRIEGFDFVPGITWELRVRRIDRANPGPDQPSYVYELVEVVGQRWR